ncbi:tRNA nucleotidyltransferase/poly(A) polymerase [Planctomycetes bacterium Poly30]|uniref:tRNA nucleotidyltransferase/poly(A) polymerase n=1 Tax=Saltatorellus ferox TaxID=2528018 RepID=A0A518ETG6_9BACT|nr:tRNA nucleotidyltransferase/poly(A) polymerase [Planctomycetes bacterium Poly30]
MEKDAGKIDGNSLLSAIPVDWREPTLAIARTMREAGERAWIVGGGVRDLILGRPIKDIDLVSAALPDRVEALFERTVAVGKAFGIIVIVKDGKEIEMATFRRERGYSDSRHPDLIEYAESPAVDAGRRDFTCNALYLDPLTGEIEDPAGGLADLRARQLRCVGLPEERFREDGLRLLRAGRFLAALDLQPAEGLLAAMEAERESIRGVSPERVLDEMSKVLRGPDPARAVRVLSDAGVLDLSLPGWSRNDLAVSALGRVLPGAERGEVSAVALGLAVLLAPDPTDLDSVADRLERLKSSKELRNSVLTVLRTRTQLDALVDAAEPADVLERGRRVALARDGSFEAAVSLAIARAADSSEGIREAVARLRALSAEAPPEPVALTAKDAMEAGYQPGPELGDVLRRAGLAALGGAFEDREGALAWLRDSRSPS